MAMSSRSGTSSQSSRSSEWAGRHERGVAHGRPGVTGVEFIAVNTDASRSRQASDVKIHIGSQVSTWARRGRRPGDRPGGAEGRRARRRALKGRGYFITAARAGHRHRCGGDPGRAREGGARRLTVGRDEAVRLRGPPDEREVGTQDPRARRHADRDRERPAAPGGRRRRPRSSRRSGWLTSAARASGDHRPDHRPGPREPRLRGRPDDHDRHGAGARRDRHRLGRNRAAEPRAPPSPRRCSRRRSRARPGSSSTCPAPRTSASSR